MPKLFSSREIVKVLEHQGFVFVSQHGSHAKYRKRGHTVIAPAGAWEIPHGTFRSILHQSGLDESYFE